MRHRPRTKAPAKMMPVGPAPGREDSCRSGRLLEIPAIRGAWTARLGRLDPIGPLVLIHAATLTAFSVTRHPVGVMVVSSGLFGWRIWLGTVAARTEKTRRGRMYLIRAVGSLILMGGIVALDAGTESPLFFSMIILIVWEAVVTSLRRLIVVGITAVGTVVGVIVVVPDITATSLIRVAVFAVLMLLLIWARAMSESWQRESAEARVLAAKIAQDAPVGFALYQRRSLDCLFANDAAAQYGLDNPNQTTLWPYRETSAPGTVGDVLADVAASGESLPPVLYAKAPGTESQRFLRIGVSIQPVVDADDWLMLYAEDVTSQVTVGEQHRRFLESANHQFRTPLSPILAYGELIADGSLEGTELREAGAVIRDAGQQIEHLLDRISSLLRLQRTPTRHDTTVTLRHLVEHHPPGGHPDLDSVLVMEGDPDLVLECDPKALSAALRELIENGIQHGTPPVVVSAQKEDGQVALRVWDQGPGPNIDADRSLEQTWSLLTEPEVMPPHMGERLGIAYAHTLTRTAGASLEFERDPTHWAFVFRLTAGTKETLTESARQHR